MVSKFINYDVFRKDLKNYFSIYSINLIYNYLNSVAHNKREDDYNCYYMLSKWQVIDLFKEMNAYVVMSNKNFNNIDWRTIRYDDLSTLQSIQRLISGDVYEQLKNRFGVVLINALHQTIVVAEKPIKFNYYTM